jgi:hypothetical protein
VLGCLIAIILAGSVAMVSAAQRLDLAPKVGDILVFRTGNSLNDWEFTVVKVPDVSCKLVPAAMGGGSLVVEERVAATQTYRVHWAGLRTSEDAADCGHSADLVVQREQLQLLANFVGGPGVEHHVFSYF